MEWNLGIPLEAIAQGELHQARRHRAHGLAECPTRDVALHSGRTEELCVIGDVECLGAKLECVAVVDVEVSRQSCIEIFQAGSGEEAAAPRAGNVSCDASTIARPSRGLVLGLSEVPDHSGVSTPLLFMPFGIVPSRDVSLLLNSVTGRPEVKRAMPATAIAWSGFLEERIGRT